MNLILVLVLGLSLLSVYSLDSAFAITKNHFIILDYSQVCNTYLKIGDNSSCPQLSELVPFDTSNQDISGHFIEKDGKIIREKPQSKVHWVYYEFTNKTIVCVDCYVSAATKSNWQFITIQPHSFTYTLANENSTNGSPVHSYSDAYIPDCYNADIAYSKTLLNDTINYFENDCSGIKPGNSTEIKINNTPFVHDNPFSTLHHIDLLKSLLHGHNIFGSNHTAGGFGPSNCIIHQCNFTDPYKKSGY